MGSGGAAFGRFAVQPGCAILRDGRIGADGVAQEGKAVVRQVDA